MRYAFWNPLFTIKTFKKQLQHNSVGCWQLTNSIAFVFWVSYASSKPFSDDSVLSVENYITFNAINLYFIFLIHCHNAKKKPHQNLSPDGI